MWFILLLRWKTGKCEYNDIIINEEKKFYYRCNKTNQEGPEWAECIDNYILKDGLCVDEEHCVEKVKMENVWNA